MIRRDRRIRLGLHRVLDERQTFRALGVIILGHVHIQHVPVRLEHASNVVLARVPGDVTHEHGHAWQIARVRTLAFGGFAAIAGITDRGCAATAAAGTVGAGVVVRRRRRSARVIVIHDSFFTVLVVGHAVCACVCVSRVACRARL